VGRKRPVTYKEATQSRDSGPHRLTPTMSHKSPAF
jgi:hypothetical protein